MRRIAILGSCVTRDLFTHLPSALESVELGPYVSRASLISMAAPAARSVVEKLTSQSARKFDDRRFIQDARKDYFPTLAKYRPELLVLDLIDERHGTYVFADGGVTLTKVSRDFITAHRLQSQAKVIAPFSEEWRKQQAPSLDALVRKLRELLPQTRFVVHRARYCERYLDAGTMRPFDEADSILRWNGFLDSAYDTLASRLPADTILVAPQRAMAGGTHLWDRTPFHYDVSYYHDLWAQLKGILQSGAAS